MIWEFCLVLVGVYLFDQKYSENSNIVKCRINEKMQNPNLIQTKDWSLFNEDTKKMKVQTYNLL